MACTGYKTVSIAHLDHHNAVICILIEHDLSGLLDRHALLCAKLSELLHICFCLIGLGRIYDHCACDITVSFICCDFFLRTDNNDFCKTFFKDLLGSLISTDIF